MKSLLPQILSLDVFAPRSRSLWFVGLVSSGLVFGSATSGWSLPRSPSVQSGQVKIRRTQPRSLEIIQTTPKASINWNQFSIGANEGVTFKQPSVNSVVLNRVTGSVGSDIAGTLNANGTVLLINPNGILFSPTSKVDVGSILATTLDIRDRDFLADHYRFQQAKHSPFSTVENFGKISVREGGFAALVAPGVANHGVIQAHLGQVALGSGTAFTLDFYRDGLISFEVAPSQQGQILDQNGQSVTTVLDQAGLIQADGGTVFLSVQSGADILGNLINLDGVVQAQTVANREGKIILSGGTGEARVSGRWDVSGAESQEQGGAIAIKGAGLTLDDVILNAEGENGGGQIEIFAQGNDAVVDLGPNSLLRADSTRQGNAGQISVLSQGLTTVSGLLSATAQGKTGQGGRIETSGKDLAIASSASIDVSSASGKVGTWTLDPDRLFIDDTGGILPGPGAGDFTVAAETIEDALVLGNVELQANDLIQIDAAINTRTRVSVGNNSELSILDQDANGDLTVNLNAPIQLGPNQTLIGNATDVNVGVDGGDVVQNAVDLAAPNAAISLTGGTFTRGQNFAPSEVLVIDKNLTIRGQGPTQTILDGTLATGARTRVVKIVSGVSAELQNLGVLNGDAGDGNGGGLAVEDGAELNISNLRIAENSAALGGGIHNAGKLRVFDSLITENAAVGDPFSNPTTTPDLIGSGAGIFGTLESEIDLVLSNVTQNNAEFNGGGIVGLGATRIEQTTIADNTAESAAGVLNLGSMELLNSTISGNTAQAVAGGIANAPDYLPGYFLSSLGGRVSDIGALQIINSTISGNEAELSGGGLINYAGDVEIINSTITGNQSLERLGGLGNFPSDSSQGIRRITITNSIISGNESSEFPEAFNSTYSTFESKGFNLVGQNGNAGGFPTQGNDLVLDGVVDSVLAPLAQNGGPTATHALIAGSPAIDQGSNDFAMTVDGDPLLIDQRGGERSPSGLNSGDTVDIGAFEATSSYVVTQTEDQASIGNLRGAVEFANLSENFNPANLTTSAPNTIRFDQGGLFANPQTIALQKGQLTFSNPTTPIVLEGTGIDSLFIDGEVQSRVFALEPGLFTGSGTTVTINDVTIENGQAEQGGAVLIGGGDDLTLNNVRIRNSESSFLGGGIANRGVVSVNDSIIEGNTASFDGGGIANQGLMNINNSIIEANIAMSQGGGISNSGGTIVIQESSIVNNESDGDGGGLLNEFGSPDVGTPPGNLTVIDSAISNNVAGNQGGGLANKSTALVQKSLIFGNTAAVNGGGVHSENLLTLENTTISGNEAAASGGGINGSNTDSTIASHVTIASNRAFGGGGIALLDDATLTLNNSIVSGNVAAAIGDEFSADSTASFVSNGNNFVGQMGESGGFGGGETTFTSAFETNLAPLGDFGGPTQTHALLIGSDAIDSVPNLLSTDQRGFLRPQGAGSDAGAFEFLGATPPITPPVTPPTPPVTPPITPPVTPPITPPVTPPTPPVTPPITPPVTPPEPNSSSSQSSVEKIDEELQQNAPQQALASSESIQAIESVDLSTPAIALTTRLETQIVGLETIFSQQHAQFLGSPAPAVIQPEDVRQQLKKAQLAGNFNPAVIYTFFVPSETNIASEEDTTAVRTTSLMASTDHSIHLAQSEAETNTELDCISQKRAQSDDPLWQFDTCGWNNFVPATRPANDSDQLVLMLLTPDGKAVRQMVPMAQRSEVLAKVKAFQRAVTDISVPVSQSQKLGQEMYDWLIQPIAEDLEAEKIDNLVFIMDKGLRSMPLAAMHDGSGYLIENFSVGLMPSMSLAETDFVSVKEMQVLAMGANTFKGQSPLPSVPVEISTIAQNLWKGETFLNETFTPKALKQARADEGYGIVHLATHGEFRAGDRDRSYIQFWDSKVRIDELQDLGLTSSPPVSLLVLSACRTALGDPNAELGFTGLAVASGVQTAMGGLWYVSDLGTLGLMTHFYQNLKTAPIKAEALRQAQLSLMNGETRIENAQVMTPDLSIPLPSELQQVANLDLSHPYYWSGITMIGTPW